MSKDTMELLRECDSGIKMAVGSIDEVSGHIKNTELKNLLEKSREEHDRIGREVREQLALITDKTVAGLMTDGCDMGIKSLTRYLNEYKGADGSSRSTARRIIGAEENLLSGLRAYL